LLAEEDQSLGRGAGDDHGKGRPQAPLVEDGGGRDHAKRRDGRSPVAQLRESEGDRAGNGRGRADQPAGQPIQGD